MAVQHVLDDGKAQARAAAFAASPHIDPVEAFRQPRDGFARDSLALVLDGDENVAGIVAPALRRRAAEADMHRASRPAILYRVVDQVLEYLGQFVPIAGDAQGLMRRDIDADAVGFGQRNKRGGGLARNRDDIDLAFGRIVLVQLDPRQRKQIVDQTPHAARFHAHDLKEAPAGLCVVLGVTAQRVDETGDRGQRRAQFVACIGDEVRSQLFGAPERGEIANPDQDQRPGGAGDIGLVMALHGHRNAERDGFRLAARAPTRSTASSTSGVRSTAEMRLPSASVPTRLFEAPLAKTTRPATERTRSGSSSHSKMSRAVSGRLAVSRGCSRLWAPSGRDRPGAAR